MDELPWLILERISTLQLCGNYVYVILITLTLDLNVNYYTERRHYTIQIDL